MKIEPCTSEDIPAIFALYRMASDYQRSKQTVVVWPEFEPELVATEVEEKRQWKLTVDGEIACVWAITYSDEHIWEERDADPAVYIHRIATDQRFRGRNCMAHIVEWAIAHARDNGKGFVRLDTVGNNSKLIDHYVNSGFTFLGLFDLKNASGLPPHYSMGPACLFEIRLS